MALPSPGATTAIAAGGSYSGPYGDSYRHGLSFPKATEGLSYFAKVTES